LLLLIYIIYNIVPSLFVYVIKF